MVLSLHIPQDVESALQARATAEGTTVEAVALRKLAELTQPAAQEPPNGSGRRDLSFLRSAPEDVAAVRRAHEEYDRIDEEMWR